MNVFLFVFVMVISKAITDKKYCKISFWLICWNFAEVWISTLHIQLNVALYEAIWSYPVLFLLSLGLLTTKTSLKARIDTAASVQSPFSFRVVLKVPICELSLFLPNH